MTSSWCHQMCMNEKVNQGPLYDINVWCNRSFKTKLHPIIVRQYSHLSTMAGPPGVLTTKSHTGSCCKHIVAESATWWMTPYKIQNLLHEWVDFQNFLLKKSCDFALNLTQNQANW